MSGLVDKVKDKLDNKSGSGVGSSSRAHGDAGLKHGSKLPSAGLLKSGHLTDGSVDLGQLRGRNVIVGAPGAFSPQCSDQVPGFVHDAEKFAAKGIHGIYIVVVNDHFTIEAWKEKLGVKNHSPIVHFITDDKGAWTKAADMDFDSEGFFGNRRSQRFAAIVQDGVVEKIWVEKAPTEVTVTSSQNVLEAL